MSGQEKYLFTSTYDDTCYWLDYDDVIDTKFQHNIERLLDLTKNAIGKSPKHFIIDGLDVYAKSSKRVFSKNT